MDMEVYIYKALPHTQKKKKKKKKI